MRRRNDSFISVSIQKTSVLEYECSNTEVFSFETLTIAITIS